MIKLLQCNNLVRITGKQPSTIFFYIIHNIQKRSRASHSYQLKKSSYATKEINLPVTISTGNKITTHNKLNMSWTVAPAKARRNWFLSAIWPIATMVLVTDVPIFAPIVIGMAVRTVRTKKRKWNKIINICNFGKSNRNLFAPLSLDMS